MISLLITPFLHYKTFVLFVLFTQGVQTTAYRPTSNIVKVTYALRGGEFGHDEYLEISNKRIVYNYSFNQDHKHFSKRISHKLWSRLIETINLADFDKVPATPREGPLDTIDLEITIEENNQRHTLKNPLTSSAGYKNIQQFIIIINEQLRKCKKKINV